MKKIKRFVTVLMVAILLADGTGNLQAKAIQNNGPNVIKSEQFGRYASTTTTPSSLFTNVYGFSLPSGLRYYTFDQGSQEYSIKITDSDANILGIVRYHFCIADTDRASGKGVTECVLVHTEMSSRDVVVGKKHHFIVFEDNEILTYMSQFGPSYSVPKDTRILTTLPERTEQEGSSSATSSFSIGISGGGGKQGGKVEGSFQYSLGWSSSLSMHAVEVRNYSQSSYADVMYKYTNYHGALLNPFKVGLVDARRAFNITNTQTHNAKFSFIYETPYDNAEVKLELRAHGRLVETKSSMKTWNGAQVDVTNTVLGESRCIYLQKWYDPYDCG